MINLSLAWFTSKLPLKKRIAFFIATAGGAGLLTRAPGTIGSAVAAILYLGLGRLSWTVQLGAIVLCTLVGIWAIRVVETHLGVGDHGCVVIDEVIGMWTTLVAFAPSPGWLIVGFILFRLLDIFKPFPANFIDRNWKGSFGVVFDDVVSGIYGQILMRAFKHLGTLL